MSGLITVKKLVIVEDIHYSHSSEVLKPRVRQSIGQPYFPVEQFSLHCCDKVFAFHLLRAGFSPEIFGQPPYFDHVVLIRLMLAF